MSSSRVMRRILLLEEFSPTFTHLPGKENVIADSLSRHIRMDDPTEEIKPVEENFNLKSKLRRCKISCHYWADWKRTTDRIANE